MPHNGLVAAFPGDGALSCPSCFLGAHSGPVRPVSRNAALCRHLVEAAAVALQRGDPARALLPAADDAFNANLLSANK